METQDKPQFLKYLGFAKVDSDAHTVTGVCTAEVPDSDNEICDYAAAKAEYARWSSRFEQATTAAGQEPSKGNIRVMHKLILGGKAVDLQFDDDKKQIVLASEPLDDVWKLVKGGFLTGYSQGGDYAWRKCDTCGTDMSKTPGIVCPACQKVVKVRYAPVLSEVSYVDNPNLKRAHFAMVKADGGVALEKLYAGEDTMEVTNAVPAQPVAGMSQADIDKVAKSAVAQMRKAEEKAAARKDRMTKLANGILNDRLEKRAAVSGLEKSLYDVARFAEVLCSVAYLHSNAVYEADYEGDESQVPAELKENLEALADTFLQMAEEEARELTAAKAAGGGTMNAGQETPLTKAAKTAASHITKMAKAVTDHHEKVQKLHKDHHDAMHGHIAQLHKILGTEEADADEGGGEEPANISPTAGGTKVTYGKGDAPTGMVKIGTTADGVSIFADATEHAAAVKKAAGGAPAAPAVEGGLQMTKAELEAHDAQLVEATVKALLKAVSGEDEEDGEADGDGKKGKKVAKADGVGERGPGATLPGAGPAVRVIPFSKAEDTGTQPAAAAVEQVDMRKVMSGDKAEQLKFMKSVRPAEMPSTVASIGALAKRG